MQASGKRLDGLRVAILVTDDFEQAEMTEPRKALDQAGAVTKIISNKPGQVQGVNHDEKADTFPVDMTLDQANPGDFDAILLPGGAINADTIRMEPKARQFVQQIDQSGRPMAVICHAPWLLVSSGCAKGRTMTSYYTVQDDLRNAGANWVDQEVVRDGNLVTSRSPKDLPAFNPAVVSLFAEYKEKGPISSSSTQKAQDVITG
ncbi:type 1 glutamine amidotransferase domain-containing protein [Dictyobacter aurantiacus]|uniref:Glutamine amidotransferase n=1 Tax=Dictyobacter aurantiacus TaxID=1936993 RepID=A0A401ZC40_9CHLR|nr:type 1 glutamine amidotransferase domain-containing protein [Dictyobacter aurantiacus]GCE04288.1 glutamine amidotransferase [Dictyobacter aurantiacus]